MDIVGQMSNNSSSHEFPEPNGQMGLVEPISINPMFGASVVSNTTMPPHYEPTRDEGFSSIWMSADLVNEDPVILSSLSGHEKALPVKRKSDFGFNSYNFVSEQQIFPDKLPVHSDNDIGLVVQQPASYKTLPSPRSLNSQPLPSKKLVRENVNTGKPTSQRVQPVKKQFTQNQSSSKAKQETSESVRSKMRESLAAALELTSAYSDKALDNKKDQGFEKETTKASLEANGSGQGTTKVENIPSGFEEGFPATDLSVSGSSSDSHAIAVGFPSPYSNLSSGGTFHEFQYTSMLVDEDSQFSNSFFVKDDLLQGNGLSWAMEFDVQMNDGKEAQSGDELNSAMFEASEQEENTPVEILTAENVAFKIEAELFRLFGGVNKKYKEKGRSLLFNLKDRNNPELRERVMSGEISPERLCAMSAEELASKELSEWRMAKAEELAQMKVLPEVDISRLVRKTHKGEYQVELERDDDIVAADLSVGASILTQTQPKRDVKSDSPVAKTGDGSNANASENQDSGGSLVIPADGDDLMQKLMVEESKNPKVPPPIVSLDEFMESLNSEPPFEKLSPDADQNSPKSRERLHGSSKSSRMSSKGKDSNGARSHKTNTTSKVRDSPKQKDSETSTEDSQYAWEGVLQFNTSSSVTVHGLYQSGEKTSTKQWPSSLDIKGRVRLGAFEKFVQDLPMSRTRAVMVLKLELKNKASKAQETSLSEAISSYTSEERLGYAEPMPGVEIYLCPWTARVAEMVKYYIPKESVESIDAGLIGFVIWRRAKSSKQMSPKSPSHLKHHSSSKKQSAVAHIRSQEPPKVKSISPKRDGLPHSVMKQHEMEEDIPPGFGPSPGVGMTRDDDDLPEFNFSGQVNTSLPRIPPAEQPARSSIDKVRELIQKYGQSDSTTSSSMSMNRMNGMDDRSVRSGFDDDDDIPEWQPQAPHVPLHQQSYNVPSRVTPTNSEQFMSDRWVQKPRQPLPPPPRHHARWRPY